jgi:two-component system NtrC family sensor kinase
MIYAFVVLFISNLGAMVDWVFHPEITYFDEEHLIVGGITAITVILLLVALEMYLARRIQMEATLHESNDQLRSTEAMASRTLRELDAFVSTNPDIAFTVDLNVNLIWWNPAVEVVTGLAPEALKNRPVLELIVEEDRPSTVRAVQNCLENGIAEAEIRVINAQGGSTLFRLMGVLLKDEEGRAIGITGMGRDITEKKAAEEEIRDAHQRLTIHDRQMPLGHITYDKDFRVVGWNPAAERIFGWSAEEVKGKHPFELFVRAEAQAQVSGVFTEITKGDDSSYSIDTNLRKDGKIIVCEWFVTRLRDASGNLSGACAMAHDVTEKTQLERQLLTAQKMEAVGTLAGGIAHDFNNALTGIVGFGELLRMRMAGDEQALHDLDEILHCAERATTLTRQLLTFARRQVIEPVHLNLSALVADLMKLIGKLVGEHIEVKTTVEKDVPTIHADRGQIEQVVMNLCLNARDAMPEGGRLVVETGDVVLDEEYVRQYRYMKTGRYALLTVSDTGIGMDEKTCERIFEPFFTTKGPDKGTGLGLAMVYGIVKQHGGFIHLYSEQGKGTAFKVYFPAIEAQPDAVPERRMEEIVRGGTETILLAEDEEAIRGLAERILTGFGYTVLMARNGEEAIEIFRRNTGIVLAVLDVVMPRKGGKEAFEEMRKQNPRLKAIFMSGYSADAIHDSFVLIPGTPFLQKPFAPTMLARKVREVLDTQ